MDWMYLLKGLVIGISIAAPVGPIGVLCIRRTIRDGAWTGFVAGMGAATADAAYGCVAGFGLTAISGFLVSHQSWLSGVGGAFLCFIGVKTFLAAPAPEPAQEGAGQLLALYGSTFLLTVANPATIFAFMAVFAGFGLGGGVASYGAAGSMVLGVLVGSAAWWLTLSQIVGLVRTRVELSWMKGVNRVSGVIVIGFGLFVLGRLVF